MKWLQVFNPDQLQQTQLVLLYRMPFYSHRPTYLLVRHGVLRVPLVQSSLSCVGLSLNTVLKAIKLEIASVGKLR